MSDTSIETKAPEASTTAAGSPCRNVCPACGDRTLATWYEGSSHDVGDVEPRAECTSLYCTFEY
jgi:hypothetical protein